LKIHPTFEMPTRFLHRDIHERFMRKVK